MKIDILRIGLWISIIFLIIMLAWKIFGNSPTEMQVVMAIGTALVVGGADIYKKLGYLESYMKNNEENVKELKTHIKDCNKNISQVKEDITILKNDIKWIKAKLTSS